MNEIIGLKLQNNDFVIEFEILPDAEEPTASDSRKRSIYEGLRSVNSQLSANQHKIDELNKEIDRLTNHADGIDYMVAVGSGILAGIVDSFWVGEFSLDRGSDWSKEKVNNFVVKVAKSQGYEGDDLNGAISKLEKMFGAPSDSNTSDLGGGLQHHLRDFAHHPNLVGLTFSMLTQFTEKAYGTDTNGVFTVFDIKDKTLIGKDIPEKFLFGTVFWFFHVVSDIAGTSSRPGAGTGLPGPLLSLAKELSTLPFFKDIKIGDNGLSVWISKLFNGTLLAKRNSEGKIEDVKDLVRFDFRAELGVLYELGRQAIPVILNECIVRGFYFIRRLTTEIKNNNVSGVKELSRINWKNVLPFKNRTIVRMLTIATGTFTAVDLGDAAIRAGAKSGGTAPAFAIEFLLRVNFVGVGRFVLAVGTDIYMGVNRSKSRNERMHLFCEQLHLMNANVFYLQADMWISAETAQKSINEAFAMMEQAVNKLQVTMDENNNSLHMIGLYAPKIGENNPDVMHDILKELEY